METPQFLMGKHAQFPEDMIAWVYRILSREAGISNPREAHLQFENAGEVVIEEDPTPY